MICMLTESTTANHPTEFFSDRLKQLDAVKLTELLSDSKHMAEKLHMSKSSLYQKMKTSTGQTPFEYMRNCQNEQALELLSDDSYNISEIAYKVGFNDPQYFSRYFRSKFGISPRQYREKMLRNKPVKNRRTLFLDKVNAIIEANQTIEDYSLEVFANDMQMSKSTLYRKIKDATGFSPYEYVRIVRIKNAYQLLTTTNSDIFDAANAVGFRDVKYFSRCFKEELGKYPSQVIRERETLKNQNRITA